MTLKKSKTPKEKVAYLKIRQEHLQLQQNERQNYHERATSAANSGGRVLSLIMENVTTFFSNWKEFS